MALKVTHELAGRQRYLWVKAPLKATVDGIAYEVAEWSLAGIAVSATASAPFATGKTVQLKIELPFQGFDIGFRATGTVEGRILEDGRTIIAFCDLGQREKELLSHFVEQLLRGNMTSVDETILRLDAPLAANQFAATSGQTVAPATAQRTNSGYPWWPSRLTTMSTLYGVAGLMAMSYLGWLAYRHVFWLETQTSAISAPVASLVSHGDGIVTWTNVKPGDVVKAGDVVAFVSDNTLEQNIEQAAITVRDRENKHAYLVRRLDVEKKRQEALFGVSSLKAAQSSAELDALNARLQTALRDLRQLPATAVGPLAQARDRVARLKQSIALKTMTRQGSVRASTDAALSSDGATQPISADIDALTAQVELAQSEIGIATRRHESYLRQRDRLSLRAPFDGILRSLPHTDHSTVRRGDVAAVVERAGERGVTAYVRQEQLANIRLGAEAVVHVPATRQTFKATVTEIDPIDHDRRERGQHGSVATAVPTSKYDMATVRLALTGANIASDANVYRDGLPAVTSIGLGGPPKGGIPPTATKAASGGSFGGG